MAEVNVDEGVVPGLGGSLDEGHSRLLWGSATFPDVTVGAGADDIRPDGFAAHTSGDYVVERQLTCGLFPAAILAAVFVPGEDISAVEFHFGSGQAVVEKQADYPWDGDIEIDRRDPVVAVRLKAAFEFADLAPALKVIIGVGAFLAGDDLRQPAAKQRKSPPGSYNTNSHIVLVKNKHVTVKTGMAFCGQHNETVP
jgi:hypothetical protein